MEVPKRKRTRLKYYDYSKPGVYFITICVKERKKLLSKIIDKGDEYEFPENVLTKYGEIANKYINKMNEFYDNISVDKYVIMPNHIHLLIRIFDNNQRNGPSGTPVPTNSTIAQFVSTLKRFCNKEYGENIWQTRSNDHIIRGENDYQNIWKYIDTNVYRWKLDCFYIK